MSLTEQDMDRVELRIRQYFDGFLENGLPEMFTQHQEGCGHGKRFNKLIWFGSGVMFAGGGGIGFTIAKLFTG